MLQKTESGDWDENLATPTEKVNDRVVHHLQMAPSTIVFGLEPSAAHLDTKLAFVPQEKILSPMKHLQPVRKYSNYRYDRVRQLTREKQERDVEQYEAVVSRVYHEILIA